uniref:Uncharacterized protein n=1 Tax=Oncorhynchus mykiss TaxID=8022 RepID=A0A8K9Y5X1_ONCMY
SQRMALFLLLFVAGLTLNALVVWVNWRLVSSCNGVLFCMLNVSVSDLLIIVVILYIDTQCKYITISLPAGNAHVTLLEWDKLGCYIYQHNFVDWYAAHTFLYLIFQFLGPAAIIMTFNMQTLQAVWTSPEGLLNPRVLSYQTVGQALSLFHCLANPILYNFLSRSFYGNLITNLARHLTAANEKAKELSDACTSQSDL